MTISLPRLIVTLGLLAGTAGSHGRTFQMDFDGGVDGWRTVVDGVMGGRSSGRISAPAPGTLRFTGDISLENNGGFSQMRTNVAGDDFIGANGVELVVRGDGRAYKFDVRLSNVRMMAGAYQRDFQTTAGEWTTIRLPFDEFRLYSFGRRVPNAPAIEPVNIESIGVTLADKKSGPFELEVDSIRTFGGTGADANPRDGDLVSVAKAAGLNTLLELVTAAGLDLPQEPVTIFAPTDAAFAALPEATVRALLRPEGRDTLRAILTYHVAPSSISSSELLSRRTLQTLNGQRLAIDASGRISVGESSLIAVDVPFDGGIVHVVDTVLMPELKSIGELAAGTSQLSTLATAVGAAGLEEQLGAENGPWTVFAPIDSAFDALPDGALESLLEPGSRQRLAAVLGLHVVPGRLFSTDFLASGQAQTLFGEAIEFDIDAGDLRVDGATIISSDIQAANGVVHLIDAVLLPREAAPVSASMAMEAARLCELAVNRGSPLFNAGQHAGCAAVYELTIESMLALGSGSLGRDVIRRLEMASAEAEAQTDWSDKAWTYRRALDDAYTSLTRRGGSSTTMSRR